MADEQYELTDEPRQDAARGSKVIAPEQTKEVAAPLALIAKIEDTADGSVVKALTKLQVSDASLTALRAEVDAELAIYDGSKGAYERLGKLRNKIVRTLRTPVKDELKAAREQAIAFQRLCVAAENAITGFYQEQEGRLKIQEELYEAEVRRQAEEAARIERERVEGLFSQLKAVEWRGNELIVAQMTPEQFDAELKAATAQFEELQAFRKAEADRKAAEEKAAAELAETNRKEAERLAEVAKQQKAEQDKLDAARREQEELNRKALQDIEDRKAAALKEVQDAKDKAAAEEAERQRVLAEQKAAEEAAEKKRLADIEAERLRQLAAPDREKVGAWADKIEAVLKEAPLTIAPPLSTIVVNVHKAIAMGVDHLREQAK
jgi:hypothetical protein